MTLSSKVEQHVMNLEDIYVNIIDKYSSKEEVSERELILDNQKELIATLNSGMKRASVE